MNKFRRPVILGTENGIGDWASAFIGLSKDGVIIYYWFNNNGTSGYAVLGQFYE